jgi:hypothetical protein
MAPYAIQALREHGIELRGKKALKTTAVDRYGMARALVEAGCEVTFGDLMFALNIPIPVRSLRTVHILAALLLPVLTNPPFSWVYPLGEEQEKEPSGKYSRFTSQDFIELIERIPLKLQVHVLN